MEQFRQQEWEALKRAPAMAAQQSEPLLLEELLELNIQEDSKIPPAMQRLLLATESDLPLTLNEKVLRYVNYFLGRGRRTLRASLSRAGAYKPMISQILAEERVPQELIYLVQAESGFQAKARSRKKATGMWQFVAWRGREYGLQQDRLVDERLDPEKATRAAARHLADLYEQFGDWYLAMAAYNCGPGCVQRAVDRTAYADYWELVNRKVLPRETSNYVPIILTMALLGKNAPAFDLQDIVAEDPIDYDTVETTSRIGIGLIADATGTTAAEIRGLNPALLGSTTPDGPYSLRIPKDMAGRFEREIAAVPALGWTSWRRHQVVPGQTLPQIAALYRVKAVEIAAVNRIGPSDPFEGDRLSIPVPYRREQGASGVSATGPGRYRVRPGDTLSSIARQYGVSVANLRAWNGLHGDTLAAGRMLTVRRHPAPAAPVPGRRVASHTTRRGGS
jgi:membrane-bound lytic murein transglycosylase D